MSDLPSTEGVDRTTHEIDRVSTDRCVHLLIDAQLAAVDAVLDAREPIARAVDVVVAALRAGRRVVLLGAGTSGRLAVLDASELPPTFGFDPERYQGRIAGGDAALRRSVEGAEDDAAAGVASVADLVAGDVLIGVSASGGAAYVNAAIAAARARGVRAIAVVNARESALAHAAEIAIEAITGAEPIAGSTRMRAGTAQKIVLNTISTAAMVALGKTYRNRMVDVVASNAKLRARAERLVREIAGDVDAPALLAAAGGSAKTAIVMARRSVDRAGALRRTGAAPDRRRRARRCARLRAAPAALRA
jgi:N-acetylmuramic acid 6-phosphate etherase